MLVYLVRFVCSVYLVRGKKAPTQIDSGARPGSRVMMQSVRTPLRPGLPACLSFPALPRTGRAAVFPPRAPCPVLLVFQEGILHLVHFLLDALVEGTLHVIHGALELGDPLAQCLGQVGELLGPDEDEGHNKDDDEFLHADAKHDRHLEDSVILSRYIVSPTMSRLLAAPGRETF